mmetsp:Transcript_1509/g.3164  ORF Transcript_1509/g.3164 Transcript_1509/m.3164 type:complete len:301 (-) Transcript_1509:229-1131(-)
MWSSILNLILSAAKWYFLLILPLSCVSVYQEVKLWRKVQPLNLPSLVRVFLLNVCWMIGCFLCFCLSLPHFLMGKNADEVGTFVTSVLERRMCQTLTSWFLGPVRIVGAEHLPPADDSLPVLFVSNHTSQIDTVALYCLERDWKWIAKKVLLYLPGVGQIVMVAKHILIDRKGKASIKKMYEDVKVGFRDKKNSIYIFPQGTRCLERRLPFKNGAFNIALDSVVPIVPISIDVPKDAWGTSWIPARFRGKTKAPVVLTVHPRINVKADMDREALKKQCFDVIYSCLPPPLVKDGEDKKSH